LGQAESAEFAGCEARSAEQAVNDDIRGEPAGRAAWEKLRAEYKWWENLDEKPRGPASPVERLVVP